RDTQRCLVGSEMCIRDRPVLGILPILAIPPILAALPALPGAAGIAAAHVIHVPSEQPTIASAFVAANARDTIRVAPGVYYENLIWPVKQGLVLEGEPGAAEQTILDGRDTLSVLVVAGLIDSTAMIRRLTIQHGAAEGT
ncbi:MAG: hypothetical protein QUU85_09755, partial [Candidatus Eisenbacteria bacterium]|nr:hypothetical protein [Candidatus Eisenbacteria bacterium]